MEHDKRWVDKAGHPGLTVSQFEFHAAEAWRSSNMLSSVQEFVVMHGHSCPSGPVINGGMGGGHKEENCKGVCGRRL